MSLVAAIERQMLAEKADTRVPPICRRCSAHTTERSVGYLTFTPPFNTAAPFGTVFTIEICSDCYDQFLVGFCLKEG